MTETSIDRIEEQIAHLVRAVEDLSDLLRAEVARLDRLERQVALLLGREAEREADAGSAVLLSDQRPPHW
jgi:SlyX protein